MEKMLLDGLQQLNIATNAKRLTLLCDFIKLMQKWNKIYNLTAICNTKDIVHLHIFDSLTALPFIQGCHIADIGTGAGLPGIPLAIFLPDIKFTLVDSNAKKTRFIQQIILELQLKNINVKHIRVELLNPDILFTTVIARAFSNLQHILHLSQHLIAKSGQLLAMKSHVSQDELSKITQPYSIIPVFLPGVTTKRCLIKIPKIADYG